MSKKKKAPKDQEKKLQEKELEEMNLRRDKKTTYVGRQNDTMHDLAENGMLTSEGWINVSKKKVGKKPKKQSK
jgi:hypothetical protein